MICPREINKAVTCYKKKTEVFCLFYFEFFKITNMDTHFGALRFQVKNSSVISVSSLDINSQLSIQLHILLVSHFKAIYSTPQIQRPILSRCLRYLLMPILYVPIYPTSESKLTPELVTTVTLL